MNGLSGPVLMPHSGRRPQNLVVILHGYGDSGAGILALAEEWSSALPDTVFVAPNAPEICEAWSSGYQWFALRAAQGVASDAFEKDDILVSSAKNLNHFLDAKLEEYGLDEASMAVAGFSQGAMMALYAMPRRKTACAAVLAYSGLLVAGNTLKTLPHIAKMPILIAHGMLDDVVPFDCLKKAEQNLKDAGFDVETIARPALAHSIDDYILKRSVSFLAKHFDRKGA